MNGNRPAHGAERFSGGAYRWPFVVTEVSTPLATDTSRHRSLCMHGEGGHMSNKSSTEILRAKRRSMRGGRSRNSLLALAAVMMLLAGACSDSDEDSTTETPATTEAAPEGETTATAEAAPATEVPPTEAPITTQQPPLPPLENNEACYYIDGFVVAPNGADIEDNRLGSPLNGNQINDVLAGLVAEGESTERLFGPEIDDYLNVFPINNGSDSLAMAQAVGNGAGPIYVMAPAVHWSFAPGEDPNTESPDQQLTNDVLANLPEEDISTTVAVVDTGFIGAGDDPQFEWLDKHVVALDGDPSGTGHGTFVASLIRQVSPGSRVVVARANEIDPATIVGPPGHVPPDPPDKPVTSGLHVANAIEALKAEAGGVYDVWNLSLGTYECPAAAPVVSVMEALATISAPVVAAGGNENIPTPFWPAAAAPNNSNITGVDAMNLAGEVVFWDAAGMRVPVDPGHSYAMRAPGINLVGTTGNSVVESWSGSSFASAVVSGLIASGQAPDSDYQNAEGLHYFEAGGPVQIG